MNRRTKSMNIYAVAVKSDYSIRYIGVPEPGDPFVENRGEEEEQDEDEDDGYYVTLGHDFGDPCSRLELLFPTKNSVDEMVKQFVCYLDQTNIYYRVMFTVRGLLKNVQRERNDL